MLDIPCWILAIQIKTEKLSLNIMRLPWEERRGSVVLTPNDAEYVRGEAILMKINIFVDMGLHRR